MALPPILPAPKSKGPALPPILPAPSRAKAPASSVPRAARPALANRIGFSPTAPHPATSLRTGSNPRGVAITAPAAHSKLTRALAPHLAKSAASSPRPRSALYGVYTHLANSTSTRGQRQADQRTMTALVQRIYRGLMAQNALPPGADMPAVSIDANPKSAIPHETNNTIHFPPGYAKLLPVPRTISGQFAARANTANTFLNNWAREIPVHEIAHSLQSKQVMKSRPLREGGAQAFADQMAPRLYPNLKNQPGNDTNYAGFVDAVKNTRVPGWVDKGQFNPINWDTPNLQWRGNPAAHPLTPLGTLLRGQRRPYR